MNYNPEWFDKEFVPSVYAYFQKKKSESDSENKPVFISEKQFNVISKNCEMESDGIFKHEWDGLLLAVAEGTSKKGTKYYTVNFIDNYMEKHIKTGEYVLGRLLDIRAGDPEHLAEYAKAYETAYLSLLHVTELDMVAFNDGDAPESEYAHAKELYEYYTKVILGIRRIAEEGE